jgi:hypothetical protein
MLLSLICRTVFFDDSVVVLYQVLLFVVVADDVENNEASCRRSTGAGPSRACLLRNAVYLSDTAALNFKIIYFRGA